MTGPEDVQAEVQHPTWCALAKCSARADGYGTHRSESIVVRREYLRTEVFVDRIAAPPVRDLIIVERYEGGETEPSDVVGFRLVEARRLRDALDELIALVTPPA